MRVQSTHLVSSNPFDLGTTLAVPVQMLPVVIASGTLSGSFSTPGVNISHEYGISVSAVITGSLSCSVSLYASNDLGSGRVPPAFANQTAGQSQVFLDQGIRNWSLIRDANNLPMVQQLSCSSGGGSSNVTFNVPQVFFKWVKVQVDVQDIVSGSTHFVFKPTQNTGSVDVFMTSKGNAQ